MRGWGFTLKLALAIIAVLGCTASRTLADKRVALVIGNSSYKNVAPLANPRNDAKVMADALRSLGFSLIGGDAQLDLDKAALDGALQSFSIQIQGADVSLFYYAGHGVQVRGANYLVPVGANPTREADVDFQMVDVGLVLRQMEASGAKLNLVILDACRNNPFGGRGLRATDSGLAQMRAPSGTMISYATQPGAVAQDGNDGNSPFTRALAQTIRRPGLNIFQTFNEVGLTVQRSTGGAQQPWVSSSPIDGDFYFATAPAGSASQQVNTPSSTPPVAPKGPAVAALPPTGSPPVRSVASGVESPVGTAWARDQNCNALPVNITITRPPINGEISVVSATVTASRRRVGTTGCPDDQQITGKKIMYRSNPGFHGTDTVIYNVKAKVGSWSDTITINVQ